MPDNESDREIDALVNQLVDTFSPWWLAADTLLVRRHLRSALTTARQQQREVDAGICRRVSERYELLQSRLVGVGASETGDKARVAEECETAIREARGKVDA